MHVHHIALECVHHKDFVMNRTHGTIDLLFIVFKTPCTLLIKDHAYSITHPSAILIDSYTPYKYFPSAIEYIDDYLHFAPNSRTDFLSELTFPLNTPITLSNYSIIQDILQKIRYEYASDGKYLTKLCDLLIALLMIKISEQWDTLLHNNETLPHYSDLLAVRNSILQAPEKTWTIEEMAEQAHLSNSYFQVMYKRAFGITCFTDVINTKVTHAKLLLSSTDMSVKNVALSLGYNEVYHFIRQFKKHTGLTPGAFKKVTAK